MRSPNNLKSSSKSYAALLKLKLWLEKNRSIVIFLCFVGIAFSVTAQFFRLTYIPVTPADDFAHHMAMVENFFHAIRRGQIIPILQNPFSADIPDVPLFQYYGFMTGLIALPGKLLLLSNLKALMLGIFLFRIGGAFGVYWAGKLLGGNRKVSVLAAIVYFMTPYIISNLYGRIAIPETLAHCELPFLIVGVLLGLRGSLVTGAVTIAIAVLLLSLTHPIFLLYGCGSVVLMMLVSFSLRVYVTGAVGLSAGILLSAFRWYPVFLTQNVLTKFVDNYPPNMRAEFTSWLGLFWFPKSVEALFHPALTPTTVLSNSSLAYLYFTPGWFTLPVLFGLTVGLFFRKKLSEKLIILVPCILFMLLAFAVGNIYEFLPTITWNVQFPYRLLSFVGLFVALGIPLLLPRLRSIGFAILAFLAIIQSATLLFQLSYREPLVINPKTFAKDYANYDYAIPDPYAISESDDWMFDYAKSLYPTSLPSKGLSTPLGPEVRMGFVSSAAKQYIRIDGIATSPAKTITAWLVDADRPEVKSDIQHITPGSFSVTFALPIPSRLYYLETIPKLTSSPTDHTGTLIRMKRAEGIPFHLLKHSFDPKTPMELRLRGESIFKDQAIELWFAKPNNPMIPVTGKVTIPPGKFNVSLAYPNDNSEYILVPSKTFVPIEHDKEATDQRRLSLKLESAEIVPQVMPPLSRITYEWVDANKEGPYSRRFSIRQAVWWTPSGKTNYPGTVELPIAYNPLFVFTQNHHVLKASPDDKARTNVSTNNLADDIVARYQLPLFCYAGPIMGIILLISFAVFCRRYSINLKTG